MNRRHIIFTVLSFYALVTTCYSQPIASSDKIPVLDKTKSYPEKGFEWEADVSYIQLETSKDVLMGRTCYLRHISDNRIVVADKISGDVFIFDITGKLHAKFNQKGGKGYTILSSLAYAESEKKVFIVDEVYKKIYVFTEDGELLRSFKTPPKTHVRRIYNFDKNTLFCYNENTSGTTEPTKPYFFISKENGEITDYLDLEIAKIEPRRFSVPIRKNYTMGYAWGNNFPKNCKFGNKYILANRSMDTVYLMKQDKSLTPLFTQTPSVKSEHPTGVNVGMIIHNRFLELFVESYDFKEAFKICKSGEKWDPEYSSYILDLKTGEFFKDSNKSRNSVRWVDIPENTDAGLKQPWRILEASKRGMIRDKLLKELVPKIDIQDNPVLKIKKFK
ncbi:6-bladed beta-propeller [Puteibacter caeruleilacunae]|nr:6-bladed beta-propeller [Puteibacter caeruleilacunae]